MSIESKICLDVGPGEVEKIVEDYIKIVNNEFIPLSFYSKPRIDIRPVKIKTLKERLEEICSNLKR